MTASAPAPMTLGPRDLEIAIHQMSGCAVRAFSACGQADRYLRVEAAQLGDGRPLLLVAVPRCQCVLVEKARKQQVR
jgi:hypothetical protein